MGLSEVRRQYFARYPALEALDRALRTSDNGTPVFFMADIKADADLKGSGLMLMRLGRDLERRFGINGEVAVFLCPWRDFQRRSFNAITMRTASLVRSLQEDTFSVERFTASRRVALLISGDPSVTAKIDEWQNDSASELTVVPIDPLQSADGSLTSTLAASLRERLGERDLYRTQNPVSGMDFFGRSRLLRQLSAAIDGDQNVAILGLRRSGKTSVLRELRRLQLPKRVVMPIADFQMLEDRSADDLASSIASSLNEELKVAKAYGIDVWIGNEVEQSTKSLTPSALSDRIKRVAARNSTMRIVVAVDEVESAAAIAQTNPTSIKVLLGALRSAAQARENVSLVFSGVASRFFRESSLGLNGDVDNPMFNQVASVYLTAFDLADTAALLRDLGRPMLLDWRDDAVATVHTLTGGFPFFVRDLASAVGQKVRQGSPSESDDAYPVTAHEVTTCQDTWASLAAEAWAGIVKALGIHYPAAAALLDPSLSDEDLNEWIAADTDARMAAEDLIALGLFNASQDGVTHGETLAALLALGDAGGTSVPTGTQSASLEDLVAHLVAGGESHTVEFKETSRVNVRTDSKDSRIEDAVVKSVAAFLNSDGGHLLVGVADDGGSRGLERDLNMFNGSSDRFERWFRGDLLAKRIDQRLVTDLVRTDFVKYRGRTILHVTISPAAEPAWVDDELLYRRNGNQTIHVKSGRAVQAFIAERAASK